MFITKPARTLSRTIVLSIALSFLIASPLVGNAQVKAKKTVEKAPFSSEVVVAKVNEARVAEKLSALTTNAQLTLAAQLKAKHMATNKYFGHWSPDGSTPWDFMDTAGYSYTHAGENLAVHFIKTDAMVKAWLKSPAHRANIMDAKFTETGVAVVYGEKDGEKGWIVVQMFGSRN